MGKRRTSMYLPYKLSGGRVWVFLQKRDLKTERNPGGLSVFGGGLEGKESYKEALVREVQEELGVLSGSEVFEIGVFEDQWSISKYYAEEVRDDFDSVVKIKEGDYGRWFLCSEVLSKNEVSENTRCVIAKLIEKMSG